MLRCCVCKLVFRVCGDSPLVLWLPATKHTSCIYFDLSVKYFTPPSDGRCIFICSILLASRYIPYRTIHKSITRRSAIHATTFNLLDFTQVQSLISVYTSNKKPAGISLRLVLSGKAVLRAIDLHILKPLFFKIQRLQTAHDAARAVQ